MIISSHMHAQSCSEAEVAHKHTYIQITTSIHHISCVEIFSFFPPDFVRSSNVRTDELVACLTTLRRSAPHNDVVILISYFPTGEK